MRPLELKNASRVACIGAGYVGGPTMAIIARECPQLQVHVVDRNELKIARWNSDHLPIYEPGLLDVVKGVRGKNLFFSTDVKGAIETCGIIFICVNTPTKTYGVGTGCASDVSQVESVARIIAEHACSDKIIIEKSTVPVRTSDAVKSILAATAKNGVAFSILSNPEFLAEGNAIRDLLECDRVLIGGDDEEAIKVLVDIYAHWVPRDKILTADLWSAELSKLIANAFLAQRISSINAASALCERSGADIRKVARAVGMDSRIGDKFLNASVGFGGSCFRKDVLNLCYIAESYHLPEVAAYWQTVIDMNSWQKRRFTRRVIRTLFNTVTNKKIAVLGFAFKKDTSDTRDTPAVDVCAQFLADHAQVRMYDPKVCLEGALSEFKDAGVDSEVDLSRFSAASSALEACKEAHAIVVLTEWEEFRDVDYSACFAVMHKPAFVFDGRNLLDHESLRRIGFEVLGVGIGVGSAAMSQCSY